MNSRKLTFAIGIGSIGCLILAATAPFVLWSGPRPMCHRLIDGGFQEWMVETGNTNGVYPNVNGSGSNSIAEIERFVGSEIQDHEYIPGLNKNDQGLVLMYLKKRTAYTWHADHSHTIFSARHWMVISPDIWTGGCPEGGALVDTQELKRRLEETLAFLKENNRPYWQVVQERESKFLKSLKDN